MACIDDVWKSLTELLADPDYKAQVDFQAKEDVIKLKSLVSHPVSHNVKYNKSNSTLKVEMHGPELISDETLFIVFMDCIAEGESGSLSSILRKN